MTKDLTIGVDIGGTRTKLGLVDLQQGIVIKTVIHPTETRSSDRFYSMIKKSVAVFKKAALELGASINGIGFGIPGFVFANGIVDSTYGFIEFMEDHPMKDLVEHEFNIPCRLDNDARVVALGEALFGAGKNHDRVLVITLGTGLGVGFVVSGVLSEPQPFGHMAGHMMVAEGKAACYCGKTGCLEYLVSATGLCASARALGWEKKYSEIALTAENIFGQRSVNQDAKQLVTDLINHLRNGISNYINIYAPNLIVLGGGVSKGLKNDLEMLHNPALLGPYKNYKTRLTVSGLGEKAGILGSAALFN